MLFILNDALLALERATQAGTSFVFGYLGGGPLPYDETPAGITFILAFRALPLIPVVSAMVVSDVCLFFRFRKAKWL
ncbi:MAG: hypothetical protein Q8L40_10685 [Burkholderiales bacterium]|nr:hypothetical protein [Burkholderiales bacterium]